MIDPRIFERGISFFGAKGVLFVGDRIVVYRRDEKAPNCPLLIDILGGGPDGDESPLETFVREVREEVSLNISKSDVVYAKRYAIIKDPSKEMYFFVAKLPALFENKIKLGDEGFELSLMTPQEYLKRDDAIKSHQTKFQAFLNEWVE